MPRRNQKGGNCGIGTTASYQSKVRNGSEKKTHTKANLAEDLPQRKNRKKKDQFTVKSHQKKGRGNGLGTIVLRVGTERRRIMRLQKVQKRKKERIGSTKIKKKEEERTKK